MVYQTITSLLSTCTINTGEASDFVNRYTKILTPAAYNWRWLPAQIILATYHNGWLLDYYGGINVFAFHDKL